SDSDGFKSACRGLSDKFSLLDRCNGLKSACSKIGLSKASLGQGQSAEFGYQPGPKNQSMKKGGLKAGNAASGDPYGDGSRIGDAMKKMLQVTGQMGQGP